MDEAVVRIILQDGAGGAGQLSSTGSSSTSTQAPNFDKLYREISRGVTDINAGFRNSLKPTEKKLDEIITLLEEGINWDAKDYNQEEASVGKMIGAFSRGWEAVRDEIRKIVGIDSPERQIIASNRQLIKAITTLDHHLNPETIRNQKSLIGDIVKGIFVTGGLSLLPAIGRALPSGAGVGATGIGGAASAAPSSAEVGVAAAPYYPADMGTTGGAALGGAGVGMEEILTGALIGLTGGVIGLILNQMSPEDTKEKSTNELLADISNNTESLGDYGAETTRDTKSIALHARVLDENVSQILGLVSQGKETDIDFMGAADSMKGVGDDLVGDTGSKVRVKPPPLPPILGDKDLVGPDFSLDLDDPNTPDPHVPDTALPKTELHPPPEQPGTNTPMPKGSPWDDWTPKYKATLLPTNNLWGLFVSSGVMEGDIRKRRGLSHNEYAKFLSWAITNLDEPPEGFAKGGMAGTDTIPAMLSPGEVVIPKNMVDGGAVDHLRGSLPGFAGGGMIGAGIGAAGEAWTAKNRFATSASSDTGGSLGQIGGGISAVGEKLSMALPMVGGFVKGIGAATEAFGGLVSALNQVAERYGEYSGEIAQAQAIAEVRQTMGDMRRAQEVGGEMAKFVITQSEMQQKFEDIKIKLLMQLVPIVTQILDILNIAMPNAEGIQTSILALNTPLQSLAASGAKLVGITEDARVEDIKDPTEILLARNDPEAFGWAPER